MELQHSLSGATRMHVDRLIGEYNHPKLKNGDYFPIELRMIPWERFGFDTSFQDQALTNYPKSSSC